MKDLHYVCLADELPPGDRKLIQVGKRSVGVFNVGGEFFALLNVCPHQMAPLCEGRICGYSPPSEVGEYLYVREGEIIRCPWHGWEFDIKTGRSIFNPHAVRTATYAVQVGPTPDPGADREPDQGVETFPVEVMGRAVYVRA